MKNECYSTKDFYLTAVCMAVGCKLLRLERNPNSPAVNFVLEEPLEGHAQIIAKHWEGTLNVSSKRLIEVINELKTRIHSRI